MSNPRATARLIAILARALHYAHGKGFFHCDLKPSNILIDRDGPAADHGFRPGATGDGEQLADRHGGDPGHAQLHGAEQASGHRRLIGAATDVYGLGAILYELLSGRPPFHTPSMMETVVQVLERDPVPPHELVPDVPRELETICLKCLEKMPEDRYPNGPGPGRRPGAVPSGRRGRGDGRLPGLRRWTRREPEVVSRLGGLADRRPLHRVQSPRALVRAGSRTALQGPVHAAALGPLGLGLPVALAEGLELGPGANALVIGGPFFLTRALWILHKTESTLLVGYPLMIAASGLWFRVNLVWFTTALAIAGYLFLYLNSALDWTGPFPTWAGARPAIPQHLYRRVCSSPASSWPGSSSEPWPWAVLREPAMRVRQRLCNPTGVRAGSAHLPRSLDVRPDLREQVVDAREGPGRPQPGQEVQLDHAVVEVAVEAEEMGLDLADLLAEGRVRADVAGGRPARRGWARLRS